MTTCNITVDNDADFYYAFQYVTMNPDNTPGPPIDLTGTLMYMMLRRHAADVEAVMRVGTDTGEIVQTDPVKGWFTVRIAQADLQRLALGDFDHSLIGQNGGYKRSIWSGTFTNNPGPSR